MRSSGRVGPAAAFPGASHNLTGPRRAPHPGGSVHASVGPSGAMTISGSQAAFVPVRRNGWHAGLMDGGWGLAVRAFYRPARPVGRGRPLPGRPATWTFRTARGGVHLEFSVPVAASPALAVTVQPV